MSTPLVALCGDQIPSDLTLGHLDAQVRVVPDLCRRPAALGVLDADTPVVLGLCAGGYSLGAVQREARRARVDPLGVEILHLEEADGDPARLRDLLAGAVARARAFPVRGAGSAKLTFPATTSRRSLLTFSLPEESAVPSVDQAMCASGRGCRSCIDVCPQSALSLRGARVVHDSGLCEPCGRCVTACPTGAVQNPVVSSPAVEAQVRALLGDGAAAGEPRGIVFRCRRSTRFETTPGWYPVTVPCTAMVSEPWMLAPLVLGASAVAVRRCSDTGCPLDGDAVVDERLAWCAELLMLSGGEPDRVQAGVLGPPVRGPLPVGDVFQPFASGSGAAVVLAVVQGAGGAGALRHGGGPFGLVEIDAGACTGCSSCATSCPTGALVKQERSDARVISFDPTGCVACGTCVARCPEVALGAIRLTRTTDTAELQAGIRQVWEGDVTRCSACGSPIAPSAMLARFAAKLDDDRLVRALSTRCADCRGGW